MEPAPTLSLQKRLKVLIVDDDPIILEVVGERLRHAGYSVATREHALGTVQAAREEAADIVLLDVMMPALNGERLALLLRENAGTSRVGVILYSSKSERELQAVIRETRALGAISKSASEEEFLKRFIELVERHARGSLPGV